jgi:Helix-turn-helix
MKESFLAELSIWVRHISGWSDQEIQGYVGTLRSDIARATRYKQALQEGNARRRWRRGIQVANFALDRLLDEKARRGAERRTSRTSWRAKLSPGAVRRIRRLHAQGWSQTTLAEEFGVSQATIHNLLVGKTYWRLT